MCTCKYMYVHLPTHVNIHTSNTQTGKMNPVSGFSWNMNIEYVYVHIYVAFIYHMYLIDCTHNYNYLLIRVYLQGKGV